jgi:hypothetical protein
MSAISRWTSLFGVTVIGFAAAVHASPECLPSLSDSVTARARRGIRNRETYGLRTTSWDRHRGVASEGRSCSSTPAYLY